MAENKTSISQASSYESIGEFWDEHDFTNFDDANQPDVNFDIQDSIRIEAGLLNHIEKVAAVQGVSIETLVNLWLQEKLQTLSPTSLD
jgi:hypothetical protein